MLFFDSPKLFVSFFEKNIKKGKHSECFPLRSSMMLDEKRLRLFVVFLLARSEGVLHERTDGHWPYASWDRGDVGAERSYFIEFHIAIQTESVLAAWVGHSCGTNVNNHGTRLYHVRCHKVWNANRCNDDVCLTAFLLEVLGT